MDEDDYDDDEDEDEEDDDEWRILLDVVDNLDKVFLLLSKSKTVLFQLFFGRSAVMKKKLYDVASSVAFFTVTSGYHWVFLFIIGDLFFEKSLPVRKKRFQIVQQRWRAKDKNWSCKSLCYAGQVCDETEEENEKI